MKLNIFQLEPHLAKGIGSAYIVSGEEILLKNDALNMLRKAAKIAGFSERIRLTPEAGYDWEELYSLLHSNSLLAEKRIIELDFRDASVNKTASKILQEYAENKVTNTLLLMDLGKVDAKISKSAWYQAIEKTGHVITIWPIPREQLPQWIINRAKKYSLTIQHDAAHLLADQVEGNLIAAAQAIEKIYLLKNPKAITVEILQEFLSDESRFSIFDFIETLVLGDKTKALHMLNNLKQDGTEPILVLWAITRELRILGEMAQGLQQGNTYETLFQKHRIFARRQQAVRRFLGRFKAPDCWEMLTHASEIDNMIKGLNPGNPWQSLELFCLRMSG